MNSETEIWKDIPGYEGLYQASDLGRIKSIERLTMIRKIHIGVYKEKILKGRSDGHGYKKVALYKANIKKEYRIHKLIAITFLNHTPCKMNLVVDHIDANKDNNKAINLQIITNRQNCSKGWIGKSSSKFTGVYYCNYSRLWVSQITINWKKISLGRFKTELEASEKYLKALSEIESKKIY